MIVSDFVLANSNGSMTAIKMVFSGMMRPRRHQNYPSIEQEFKLISGTSYKRQVIFKIFKVK